MAGRPNKQLRRVSGNNKNTIMKSKGIIIFIVILLLAAAVYFIFFKGGPGGKYGMGIDLRDIGRATENALKNMPLTNPLEKVVNPFRDAYKNPFKEF